VHVRLLAAVLVLGVVRRSGELVVTIAAVALGPLLLCPGGIITVRGGSL
jgi:hypothetical protein